MKQVNLHLRLVSYSLALKCAYGLFLHDRMDDGYSSNMNLNQNSLRGRNDIVYGIWFQVQIVFEYLSALRKDRLWGICFGINW